MLKDNAVEFGWSEVKHGEDLCDEEVLDELIIRLLRDLDMEYLFEDLLHASVEWDEGPGKAYIYKKVARWLALNVILLPILIKHQVLHEKLSSLSFTLLYFMSYRIGSAVEFIESLTEVGEMAGCVSERREVGGNRPGIILGEAAYVKRAYLLGDIDLQRAFRGKRAKLR